MREAEGSHALGWKRTVLGAQGAYYLLTGGWPLIHYSSFELVTGLKSDDWLVKTFGALVLANGLAIGAASRDREVRPSTYVLALGSAVAMAACDAWYVARGRISKMYLVDAAVQLVLAGALSAADGRRRTAVQGTGHSGADRAGDDPASDSLD